MDSQEAWSRIIESRVAVLGTVDPEHGAHLVPVVFTPVSNSRVFMAVDDKSKSSRNLRRLSNIEADARVTLLVDHYNDDWSHLWWVRVTGSAFVTASIDPSVEAMHRSRYSQLEHHELGPWITIEVDSVSGWAAPSSTGRDS